MKARLVQIGNSRGIRLAKSLINQLGLTDEVEMEARNGALVIRPATSARAGWRDAAKRLAARPELAVDDTSPTRFDVEEWEWR